jgi:hypothetical protein
VLPLLGGFWVVVSNDAVQPLLIGRDNKYIERRTVAFEL